MSSRNVTDVVSSSTSSPAGRDQAEARDDGVRAAAQRLEHALRLAGVGRLAEDVVAERDRGVDAEHGPVPRRAATERALPRACSRTSSTGPRPAGRARRSSGATTSKGIRAARGSRAAAGSSRRGGAAAPAARSPPCAPSRSAPSASAAPTSSRPRAVGSTSRPRAVGPRSDPRSRGRWPRKSRTHSPASR